MLTNPLQYIDEIIVRIDVMQPTGHQQALHDTDVLGAEFGPTEQPVFAEDFVGGEQNGTVLVATRHHLEQQIGVARVVGQITDLVDGQNGRRGIAAKPACQRDGRILCRKVMEHMALGHPLGGERETCGVALQHGLMGEILSSMVGLA